jgi:hypothetical protein
MSSRPDPPGHHRLRDLHMRMRAGWAREELNRRLAEGADPGRDPLLRARADRLVTSASRAALAAGLERVVATLDGPATPLSSEVAVRRRHVHGARHELMRLAGELRHMRVVRPRGVAMAERLLTEPSSPLYTAESSIEIARAAREAAEAMRADDWPADHHAPRYAVREALHSLRITAL